MSPAQPTVCSRCGRPTRSIRGRCPNCGSLKDPAAAPGPPARKVRGGSIWDDLDGLVGVGIGLSAAAALVALGLLLSLDILVVLAIPVLLIPLVTTFVGDGF